MNNTIEEFSWVGSQENFVDQPNVLLLNHIAVGRYGGNSNAGQDRNEDGCLVWFNEKEDWEFIVLLDAHNTSESANLILNLIAKEKSQVKDLLSLPGTYQVFKKLEEKILNLFQSEEFLSACRDVIGETACLIVVRKDKYVWWFSVGDCILYLFHQELAALGQYQLNQRQFFEWIGQVNTFEQEVPCYTVEIRELRQGANRLFLTTDGLIECPNAPYSFPKDIYDWFNNLNEDKRNLLSMLKIIRNNDVRDSTTVVTWTVNIAKEATKPSKQ